jgi:hypothetical protein
MLAAMYSEAEQERLWEHTLHEDVLLAERGNFFLVAESLFVVAYATLLPAGDENLAAAVLAAAGFLLTVAWLLVVWRQHRIVGNIQSIAQDVLPEYKDTCAGKAERVPGRIRTWHMLVVGVPGLLFATWVFLFVIAVA